MQKRFSRFSRRSIVGAVVGLAFAAAAGVGLAQITAQPSTALSAAGTTIQSTGTQTTSTGGEDDFADKSTETGDAELEFEHADSESTTGGGQTTSTIGGATTGAHTTTSSDDDGNGQEKVDVCHLTGSGKSHTINIARPAVAAHVAHGDTEGACVATTTTTSARSTTTTAGRVKKPKRVHTSGDGNASHTSHGSSSERSHGNSGDTSHGNSGRTSHGNSGSGKSNGGGHGNGKGK